jgi:hypothetical protein
MKRWIVQGDAVASGRLKDHIEADREITTLRQVAPDVIVLEMSAERAERLAREFGDELLIEPDADLHLGPGFPGG